MTRDTNVFLYNAETYPILTDQATQMCGSRLYEWKIDFTNHINMLPFKKG